MIRFFGLLLFYACGLVAPTSAGADERKVALVIANGAYASQGKLANPGNDARLVAGALEKAGFSTITLAADLNKAAFERALKDLRGKAAGARVAMVYYAGHGIERGGRNWLLPTDVALQDSQDLPLEAINLDLVMEMLAGAEVRMVVLDACRNNPFQANWSATSRAATTRGLARFELDDENGYFVMYAAAAGQTASDGATANSPFAASLAARIAQPGLALQMLGGLVRDDVMQATGGKQRPFVSASISGVPVYLFGGAKPLKKAVGQEEALAWQTALNINSKLAYEGYLEQFPKGEFVKLAKKNVKSLKSVAVVPAAAALMPSAAQIEDSGKTAALNSAALGSVEAQTREILASQERFRLEVAATQKRAADAQALYQAQLANYHAENGAWQTRIAACVDHDLKKCNAAAKATKKNGAAASSPGSPDVAVQPARK